MVNFGRAEPSLKNVLKLLVDPIIKYLQDASWKEVAPLSKSQTRKE